MVNCINPFFDRGDCNLHPSHGNLFTSLEKYIYIQYLDQSSSFNTLNKHISGVHGTSLLIVSDHFLLPDSKNPLPLYKHNQIKWQTSASSRWQRKHSDIDLLPILSNQVGLKYVWCIIYNWVYLLLSTVDTTKCEEHISSHFLSVISEMKMSNLSFTSTVLCLF